MSDDQDTVRIPVRLPGGEHCSVCVSSLESGVDALTGVGSALIDTRASELVVSFDAAVTSADRIIAEVERLDHEVSTAIAHASWRIGGLDCPDCARTVDVSIAHLAGVLSADLNFASGVLFVEYDRSTDPRHEIESLITRMGYGCEPLGDTADRPASTQRTSTEPSAISRADKATIASGLLIAVGWIAGRLAGDSAGVIESIVLALPFALAIAVGGGLIARRALTSVRARVLDMNVLMTVAVIGAAVIGEWSEAATVVFLFSVGGMLEVRSLERTRSSVRELMDLAPPVAHVARDSGISDESLGNVRIGDRVIVRSGERVPLDGRVVSGSSAIDEAAITGESLPADKTVGDAVYAGTLNTHGLLEVEVTAHAEDTMLARVIYLVEEAQAQRAPFQRLVDRFTRWYTPAVTVLAAVIAIVPPSLGALGASMPFDTLFSTWFYRALVLLVVSCPCALVISTPVAIVSAITRASRDGVLVKGGAFLEMAPRIRALAFDKTGTLTRGEPEVVDTVPLDGVSRQQVLAVGAALESVSTHPIARSVVRAHGESGGVVAEDVAETPGRGVQGKVDGHQAFVGSISFATELGAELNGAARVVDRLEEQGRTCLVVGANARAIGVLAVADTVRDEAVASALALRSGGIEWLTMVTGDNERVAAPIAEAVGLDGFDARTLPSEKVDVVRALKERWGAVAMVGDGVNDAPALALADLGIAMGAAGSDTALETADIALMSDDLSALPRFFDLGRRTVSIIRQNVWFSVAIKLAVLLAAVLGYAPLWLAVMADTGVALLVILNSLRLLRAKPLQVMSVPVV